MAADAQRGSSSIIVPAGTFTLTIPGANEDASATGDLDLKGKITIKGASATGTVIDGNNLDRVFQVLEWQGFDLEADDSARIRCPGRGHFELGRPGHAVVGANHQ